MSFYGSGVVRIITDIEEKAFESGSKVVKFYGGINEGKDKDGEYIRNGINCEAWNQTADIITRFCENGSSFMAVGRIQEERWEDRETGAKRSKHVLKIDRVELLPRSGGTDGGDGTQTSRPAPRPAARPAAASESPFGGDAPPFDDDDIPF